ncbi:MAG: 7-carboxy-7-deazaguanine synthase QueE [Candidatus Omnitrophota bacterium]|nr:7-carboxy-7-deazaguanine synthase QueE [Candidatus Omnitrophota bacterium]
MIAKISEIFKSIQGEGLYQGREQVFVRFFDCNLACGYCDTKPVTYQEQSLEEVMRQILVYGNYHSVSLTGGEPLLQIDFLKELAKFLKSIKKITYLETNGIVYESLKKVIEYCDIIAMDFKLPSSGRHQVFWPEHKKFLEIASAQDVFVKAVITENTNAVDMAQAIAIIREVAPAVSLVLQPQNPFEDVLGAKLDSFKKMCQDAGVNVKIITQLHKKLGIR